MNRRFHVKYLCGLLAVLLLLGTSGCSNPQKMLEKQIEAAEQVDIVFSGQVFPGTYTLYFADAEIPAENLPAFCYDHSTQEWSRFTIPLPDELEFDSLRPVYLGAGGGSLECWLTLELKNGADTMYVTYDNFTSENMLAFEYRGFLSGEQRETVLEYINGQTV